MRHVYIHIPFCKRRCSYCDFAIAVRKRVPGGEFVDRVKREYDLRCRHQGHHSGPLDTLYLGGGTPSLLAAHHVAELVKLVAARREQGSAPEITLEANPDDIEPSVVDMWRDSGVNRVSVGVQSLDEDVLRWMRRPHTAVEALTSLAVLRRCGMSSFSVDVIFGLPTSLCADVTGTLERVLEYEPPHISAYGLTAEERTPLHRWIGRGTAALAPEGRYADEFLRIHELLTAAGFEHYEVSNYARPGHRSRHNEAYWTGQEYLGLGPSAHSYVSGERRWNLGPWTAYERAVAEGLDPLDGSERPGEDGLSLEQLYLGLRTAAGATLTACGPLNRRVLRDAAQAGWLAEAHGRVRLTVEGWLRLDEIAAALTTSIEGG